MKPRNVPIATSFKAIAVLALLTVGVLLVLDALPGVPVKLHDVVSAVPLILVAVAYLGHEAGKRPRLRRLDLINAGLLSLAFLLWAAYQLFPTLPHGALLNDGAIALFAFDAAMIVIGESGELLQVRVDRTSPTNWQFPPD